MSMLFMKYMLLFFGGYRKFPVAPKERKVYRLMFISSDNIWSAVVMTRALDW